MTDTTDSYPPLPPSPSEFSSHATSISKHDSSLYIRTSFSSGIIRSQTTPIPTPIIASPSTPSLRRHSQSRGHRHSKSLNSQPPPLPLPIELDYTSSKEDSGDRSATDIRPRRLKHDQAATVPLLPDNPKLWTPAHLAQYLLTALRFKGSKSRETVVVPKPVAQDIANFVVKCKLNGRVFLRLTEKDVQELGVNQLWKAALLSSSWELRKCLLKGRIWGFGLEEDRTYEDARAADHLGRRIPSTVLEQEGSVSSASSHASPTYPMSCLKGPNYQSEGNLSRSSSVLSFESDTSSKNIGSPRVARSRALSTSSAASSGVGRVQEMVRRLEKYRNTLDLDVGQVGDDLCLTSDEITSESEDGRGVGGTGDTTATAREAERSMRSSDGHSVVHAPLGSIGARPTSSPVNSLPYTNETALIETPPLLRSVDSSTIPQPAYSSVSLRDPSEVKHVPLNEEPTVEALLQEERGIQERCPYPTSWGAKAWEEDFPGGTSRRIPERIPAPRTGSKRLANDTPDKVIVPRTTWDNLSKRLGDTERRLAILEKQEAERNEGREGPRQNDANSHDHSKAPAPGGSSPLALPPYLVVIGVGVCALMARFLVERLAGRRPPP